MVLRRLRVCGALCVVLVLLGSVVAAPSPARAGNGRIAVELWSKEYCLTQDCFQDPLGVVVVRPDGSGARRIPFRAGEHGEGASVSPRFSPDGRLLAVQVESVGVAVGRPDASGFRYLYRDHGVDSLFLDGPDWSPRSNELIFSKRNPYEHRPKLIQVSTTTGRSRTLGVGSEPMWSPDGRWIAFIEAEDYGSRVMLTPAHGRGRHTLTKCASECNLSRWSSDGRKVVFGDYDRNDGDGARDYSVNIATHRVVPVPRPRSSGLLSPDRRLIATSDSSGIYVASRDGSHRRRIMGTPQQWGAADYELADWQHTP